MEEAVALMPNASSYSPVKNLEYIYEENLRRETEFGGSDFGGYPTLAQRTDSFDVRESMRLHCGLVFFPSPSFFSCLYQHGVVCSYDILGVQHSTCLSRSLMVFCFFNVLVISIISPTFYLYLGFMCFDYVCLLIGSSEESNLVATQVLISMMMTFMIWSSVMVWLLHLQYLVRFI